MLLEYLIHFKHLIGSFVGKWKKCVSGELAEEFSHSLKQHRQPPIAFIDNYNYIIN
jgi:hypothetical protein